MAQVLNMNCSIPDLSPAGTLDSSHSPFRSLILYHVPSDRCLIKPKSKIFVLSQGFFQVPQLELTVILHA